ncbi:MAG: MBL fold metallo-hydrolase [Xanthobacteraceae bacterium]
MSSRKTTQRKRDPATRIVMLGTGTPRPDPERSGPATAIVVNGTPYLIDFGPGIVRRAAAAYQNGTAAFGPGIVNIRTAFLTHLHADHTAGYPDLILTPWIMGRKKPLDVYGPKGLKAMTACILRAWKLDIANRVNGIDRLPPAGCAVRVHEIGAGRIYADSNIRVTAFPVRHGAMKNSFGFRFETPDRTIVISGDTAPTPSLAEHAEGCDVLIHEAYSQQTYDKVSPRWQEYRRRYHTSSKELAELARRVKPQLLIIHHRANPGGAMTLANPEDALLKEIRQLYRGDVVVGHDLQVF